jgi:hypothetical protein
MMQRMGAALACAVLVRAQHGLNICSLNMQSQYAVSIYRMYLVLAQHGLRAICAQLQVQCLQYELHQLSDCVTCQEYS